MRADDDGFVNPKMVMRMIGSNDDELKVLLSKRFLLPFESGVVVIKHWLIHNLIRADLYKETLYKKEKSLLGLNENGAYTELRDGINPLKTIEPPKWLKQRRNELRTVNVPQTALRIGKDRIGKDINTYAHIEDGFKKYWDAYPKKVGKTKASGIWQRKGLDTNLVVILEFIKSAATTDRWKKGFIPDPVTFLNQERWQDDIKTYNDHQEQGLSIKKY